MRILIVRTFPDILKLDMYNVQEIGLAKSLIMAGHICDIVFYHGKNPDWTQEVDFVDTESGNQYSFKIYWLHGYNFVKNGFMPSVKKIIPEYDVIQVDEYDLIYSWMLYTGMIRPTVIYHGLYYSTYTKGYNLKCKIFDQVFLRWRKHDHVVALTKSEMASDFLRGKGFKKVYTAGVGIDKDNFLNRGNQPDECRLPADHDKIRLLYVGKIEERRNSLFLLDILAKLREYNNNLELVVVGTGEAEYLKAFMEKGRTFIREGSLIYFKEARQTELAMMYARCDLFVFPSNYEIFGMVLLEAMYFGLPVVSSLNGGSSVLIASGENGVIVECFEAEEWSTAIAGLLQDKEKQKIMREKAAVTIKENFLWNRLADRFLECYQYAIDNFGQEKR